MGAVHSFPFVRNAGLRSSVRIALISSRWEKHGNLPPVALGPPEPLEEVSLPPHVKVREDFSAPPPDVPAWALWPLPWGQLPFFGLPPASDSPSADPQLTGVSVFTQLPGPQKSLDSAEGLGGERGLGAPNTLLVFSTTGMT